MQGIFTMFKMNFKLLLRNKGYLVLLIVLPILSVVMLKINNTDAMFGQENATQIHEMSKDENGIVNMTNNKLGIKVYDCSNTDMSEYIIKELAKTGTYSINRYRSKAMDISEVREKALESANHSVIGAVIYIPDSFEAEVLKGGKSNITVFKAMKDARVDLLDSNIDTFLQSVYHYAAVTGYDKESINNLLEASMKNEMKKKTVSIEVGDALNLSARQKAQSSSIGYSLAFLTICFLFSGVFIANTVIEERQNRVYNRFILSTASMAGYGLVKLLMVLVNVFLETGIIVIAIKLLVRTDFGIPFISYIFLVFCLGLLFTLLSVVIGVLTNSSLNSGYIAFFIWCFSCMLAGLYFPLDGASKWWSQVSMLMPQRWVVKASEMLMAGKSGVYSMFLMVFFSFLIVILSIGLLGIKIRRKE